MWLPVSDKGQDLFDRQCGGLRVCKQECDTCIFKPDSPFRTGPGKLRDGRFKQLVASARADESYITCHKTLDGDVQNAICRGFYNRFSTNTIRVLTRVCGYKIKDVEV